MKRAGTRKPEPGGEGGTLPDVPKPGHASRQVTSAGGTAARSRSRATACQASNVGAISTDLIALPPHEIVRGS